ncbi:unnamed protein product [Vitrella brassicaformis CCMP3155]|uniref:Uncharacterized protein n=1 Tax=Vitrella brassicaformis (strain CCMP3155) TaxID=1169540 RepID=A0A0G4GXG4_VITBC|nr:unnamed protein product [Vitrella brassicaformis CCMP3155]|eukprot:CEM35769.1 unnamed protein product [Vitrella brassicaformis CCMP3155]
MGNTQNRASREDRELIYHALPTSGLHGSDIPSCDYLSVHDADVFKKYLDAEGRITNHAVFTNWALGLKLRQDEAWGFPGG